MKSRDLKTSVCLKQKIIMAIKKPEGNVFAMLQEPEIHSMLVLNIL
jgi:hypothetical protein